MSSQENTQTIPDATLEGDNVTSAGATTSASGSSLETVMESMVRVTLAGLGGSIIGLAQERRLESMRVVTGAAATAAARRKRSPSAQLANLPLTWALSCVAFCGIIEASRLVSPSSRVMQILLPEMSNKSNDQIDSSSGTKRAGFFDDATISFLTTVADFTIGGAVGGFASSMGQNNHLRKQLPSSMLRGSQRFFGVGPGIGLGFAAGILQAATDASVDYFERQQR